MKSKIYVVQSDAWKQFCKVADPSLRSSWTIEMNRFFPNTLYHISNQIRENYIMNQDLDYTLIVTRYKGNPDSILVKPRIGETLEQAIKRLKIKGIEDIFDPGLWHYDAETYVPVPN